MSQKESSNVYLANLSEQDARQVQWQTELKGEDWSIVHAIMTRLFQLRRLPDLVTELPIMNEKLIKLSKSNIGPFLGEFYQEQLLKKCMIILRQDVVEEQGTHLLSKLVHVWTQFYTSILPTLQAFFAPIQLKGLSVRALTIISFRDIVVLKTNIAEALDDCTSVESIPPEIKQMLLVLQSVHKIPPSDQFYQLQNLVKKVVHPYLCMEPQTPLSVQSITASVKRHSSLGGIQDKLINQTQRLNSPDMKTLFDPER